MWFVRNCFQQFLSLVISIPNTSRYTEEKHNKTQKEKQYIKKPSVFFAVDVFKITVYLPLQHRCVITSPSLILKIYSPREKNQSTLSIRLNYGTADLYKFNFLRPDLLAWKGAHILLCKKIKTMNKTFTFFSFNFRTSKIERVSRAGQNNDQQKSGCIRL